MSDIPKLSLSLGLSQPLFALIVFSSWYINKLQLINFTIVNRTEKGRVSTYFILFVKVRWQE